MNNKFLVGLVGLLAGLALGYAFPVTQNNNEMHLSDMDNTQEELMGHMEQNKEDMPKGMSAGSHMAHTTIEVDKTKPTPTLKLEVLKDTKDGYNVHLVTTNYVWSPTHVNQKVIQGEGHAHLYINNVKLARVYGDWFHVSNDKLVAGENTIHATLNANDHSEWVINDKHIEDYFKVTK